MALDGGLEEILPVCNGWDRRSSVGMLLRVIGVRYIVSVRQVIRRDREDAINTSDET